MAPHVAQWAPFSQVSSPLAQTSSYTTGCHFLFKTFHQRIVNIYRYGFKSPARDGDLKSMNVVRYVTSTLVNDSFFFCSSFFVSLVQYFSLFIYFSMQTTVLYIYIYIYIYEGPLSKFQPGPHTTLIRPCTLRTCFVNNLLVRLQKDTCKYHKITKIDKIATTTKIAKITEITKIAKIVKIAKIKIAKIVKVTEIAKIKFAKIAKIKIAKITKIRSQILLK